MFLLISLATNSGELFMGYSLLAPLAWAPFATGAFTLIAELVPRRSWATGQTLFALWMWSVGGMWGPLIGGFIAQRWGLAALFATLFFGGFCFSVTLPVASRAGRPEVASRGPRDELRGIHGGMNFL